jgi:integrase
MGRKEIRQVDHEAMERVLERCRSTVTELILRLAWEAGLTRQEIAELQWPAVALDSGQIDLPERSVPISAGLEACLRRQNGRLRRSASESVILSERLGKPMHPVYISKVAREALETEESLSEITLKELRYDFIVRMLEQHDWTDVMRLTGMSSATLYNQFSPYIQRDRHRSRCGAGRGEGLTADQEYLLWRTVQQEDTSPAGLALWLAWQTELSFHEILALTWDQVDLDQGVLRLDRGPVLMQAALRRRLTAVRGSRSPEDDPHVLLTPRSRRPFRADRLSRVIGEVLIENGLPELNMAKLSRVKSGAARSRAVLERVEEQGSITVKEVQALLEESYEGARGQLQNMARQGELVKIGVHYYPAGAVVPPEKQYQAICAYLEEHGSAKRAQLAAVLHIGERPCGWILSNLVREGKLLRSRERRYTLPEDKI